MSQSEIEVRYELSGTMGVDAVTKFSNVLFKNYMLDDTSVCCEAAVRLPKAVQEQFHTSYKTVIAACGLIAYKLGHAMTVTSGGYEGIPKGYSEVNEADWAISVDEDVSRSLASMFRVIDITNVYHVQALLYYTKFHKFKFDDDYEAVMNLVRFLECVVLGIRRGKGQTGDIDVKLGPKTNQNHLLDLGLSEDDLSKLLEINGLRNQLVGHGLLSPEIEELFGLQDTSKNMPKYYISTPGPTYGLGHYVSKRMEAVDNLFKLYFGF